jgi:hypothetical protein
MFWIPKFWSQNFGNDFDCLLSTKAKFRRNCDIGILMLISILESEFRFRHWNSDFGTRFQYQCRNFIAFLTEISQKFYFDCLSEFWFRPSKLKSKFRLLSIIPTNNFVKSQNWFWSEFRSKSDEINFGGNPISLKSIFYLFIANRYNW